MIAAALAGQHFEVAPRESGGGTRAAEMDEGGEILLLLCACLHAISAGENIGDIAVEIDGCELDRMARDRADVEEGRTAAGLHNRMVPDAELCCLGIGAIDHLVEADGARRRLVDRERVEAPSPAPIGAVHRIARTLDLRQRGQQFRRDRIGGVGAKQRPVLPPCFGRLLVEPVTDEGEQLGGLEDHVIEEVHERDHCQQDRHAARDPNHPRRARELPPRLACALAEAAKAGEEDFSRHVAS